MRRVNEKNNKCIIFFFRISLLKKIASTNSFIMLVDNIYNVSGISNILNLDVLDPSVDYRAMEHNILNQANPAPIEKVDPEKEIAEFNRKINKTIEESSKKEPPASFTPMLVHKVTMSAPVQPQPQPSYENVASAAPAPVAAPASTATPRTNVMPITQTYTQPSIIESMSITAPPRPSVPLNRQYDNDVSNRILNAAGTIDRASMEDKSIRMMEDIVVMRKQMKEKNIDVDDLIVPGITAQYHEIELAWKIHKHRFDNISTEFITESTLVALARAAGNFFDGTTHIGPFTPYLKGFDKIVRSSVRPMRSELASHVTSMFANDSGINPFVKLAMTIVPAAFLYSTEHTNRVTKDGYVPGELEKNASYGLHNMDSMLK